MAGNRFFGITSRLLMAIVAGLLVLSYLSVVINPAKVWPISLSGIFFVPLSIANLVLLLWALKRRSRSFIIPLLAFLPALLFLGRYVRFSSEEVAEASCPLKIVSYNVGRFALGEATDCEARIMDFIRESDADIVCLQEFYVNDVNALKENIRRHLKGYRADYYMFPTSRGAFGNVTLSRRPVVGKGKIKFEESSNLAIYTDYEVAGRRFRVYNCHFESYNISFAGLVRAAFRADGDVFTDTGNKMKRSIMRRPRQVEQVFADIERCPVEAFVCGDFNDNPMSYTYYRLLRGRKDAFVEAGKGFGATFALLWPMLRIDYVLFPERYRAVSHEIPRVEFSDHYPVVAQVDLL